MQNTSVEFKVSKITNAIRSLILIITFLFIIILLIFIAFNGVNKLLIGFGIVGVILTTTIYQAINNIRYRGYKFVLKGNNVIEEYDNNVLIRTIDFAKINGIKGDRTSETFAGSSIDETYPVIYGVDKSNSYIEFVPKVRPDWNRFLYEMKRRVDQISIDSKLAKYVSIDYQIRIFGKIDTFQLFFLIVVIGGTFCIFFLLFILPSISK